jgi:hypothetical protein
MKVKLSVLEVVLLYWRFCYFCVCGADSFPVKSLYSYFGGGEQVSGCGTKPDPGLKCLNILHHCVLQSGDSVERVCWPVEFTIF